MDYVIGLSERSQHPRSFKGDGYRMGICSFSCTRNNQLLWAHYADEHRGICLGFDESALLKKIDYSKSILVKYNAKIPSCSISKCTSFYPANNELNLKINTTFLKNIIGTKYTHCKYEQEKRLLHDKYEAVGFDPKTLRSISLGLRMEEVDKNTLMKLLSSKEWKHLKWYQAKKVPKRFSLEFQEIDINMATHD